MSSEITPLDALVYASLLARTQIEWAADSISGNINGRYYPEDELNCLSDLPGTIAALRDRFTHSVPEFYSNGRRVQTELTDPDGYSRLTILWHPDVDAIKPYTVESETASGGRCRMRVDTRTQTVTKVGVV